MYPELISFGHFAIHSYGFLIVGGFLLCLLLIRQKARKAGFSPDQFTDMAFWALIAGLIGGRLLYVITLWEEFSQQPMEIIKFWKGGLVFYGGFIAGFGAFFFLTKKYRLPVYKSLDIAAPSVAIAHVFGRLGCFAAGCCYGKPVSADFPLAVVFNHAKSVAPLGIPLHPAQLYDAFNVLLIFLFIEWLYRRKKFDGQIITVYGMLYAIGRSIVEIYRGDSIRKFVIPEILSTSQFIAIFIFLISFGFYFYLRRVRRQT